MCFLLWLMLHQRVIHKIKTIKMCNTDTLWSRDGLDKTDRGEGKERQKNSLCSMQMSLFSVQCHISYIGISYIT